MCREIYVAADQPLPIIKWQDAEPAFHTAEIQADAYPNVAKHFSKRFIYYIGSHQGCSCGFTYGYEPLEGEEAQTEDAAARESVRQLSQYLRDAVQHGDVELYACWYNEFEDKPVSKKLITPDEIGGSEKFDLSEKVLLLVKKRKPLPTGPLRL